MNPSGRSLIPTIADRIKMEYHPRKIILFGSYAYGEPNEDSDIDLLIIKETSKRPIERWSDVKRILREVSRKVPVCPLVYTENELKKRLDMKDFFIREVFEKGKVLYEE